jgi:hypothetical protein
VLLTGPVLAGWFKIFERVEATAHFGEIQDGKTSVREDEVECDV